VLAELEIPGWLALFGAGECLKNLGPRIPTENPIKRSKAALQAGAGEIQLPGIHVLIARRNQPCSSS
jgi:hypothetical protein